MKPQSVDGLIKAVLLSAAFFVVGFAASSLLLAPSYERLDFLYEDFRLATCIETYSNGVQVDFESLGDVSQACYATLFGQGQLNDFLIRRINFQFQHVASQLLMWMVIGLTISGVLLAAIQIISANRVYLASGGARGETNSEVSIEAGKVYVKSSVTGLAILLISFAFFFVYVAEVYTIRELGDERTTGMPTAETTPPSSGPANVEIIERSTASQDGVIEIEDGVVIVPQD